MSTASPISIPSSGSLPASWHLASGALSGGASVLALQPLDLLKTRLQQERTSSKGKIWHTAKLVVQRDGVQGLWRGTTPTLYRNVPGVSLYFLSISRVRSLLGRSAWFRAKGPSTNPTKVKLTPAGDLIVGSTARTAVGFLLMPVTVLKTISESTLSSSTPRSSLAALKSIYAQGGVRSLWRGAVPTALRDAPGAGLFIVFYERGRRLLGVKGDKAGGAVGGGVAGATASLASTLLTTPFDLIKTRRQIDPVQYPSMWSSVQRVYAQSGVLGFWEGGALRVSRKALSSAIGWAVYEGVLSYAQKRSITA